LWAFYHWPYSGVAAKIVTAPRYDLAPCWRLCRSLSWLAQMYTTLQ